MSEPITFAMPSLGADMDEGRVTEWLVRPGDHVERGQIVVVVETDKSDIEVEVFQPATIAELLVGEGDVVPVGTPIALLTPDREGATSEETVHPGAPPRVTSPVLRHLADELHVDVALLHGSGPGGRVVRDDIERATHAETTRAETADAQTTRAEPTDATTPSARAPVTRQARGARVTPRARRLMAERGISADRFPDGALVTGADVIATPVTPAPSAAPPSGSRQDSMRRHIAGLMETSWREIPHYHVARRVDLSIALDRLAETNEVRSVADRIVPGALLLCAAARAAAKVPECNGWWRDGAFERSETVDLGLVLSLRTGGIIVPTIERADELSPSAMMRQMTDLVQRARQGRLRASQMGEASITVTSLGERGADSVTGVIHPPQVALVGFGAVRADVWPSADVVVVRPTVHASLAGDHRATDGLVASRFLAQVQALLDGALPAELDDVTPADVTAELEVS